MMKIRHKILISMLLVISVTASVFFWFAYHTQKDSLLSGIDEQLRTSALMLKHMFPEGYHDHITAELFTPEEYDRTIVKRNNLLCKELGLQYLWSNIKINGDIFFTSSTSPSKNVEKGDHAGFFEKHTDPEAFDEVFSTMETTYRSFRNIWGYGRMVLIPYVSEDGRKYCFGASIGVNDVYVKLSEVRIRYFQLFLAVLLLSVVVSVPLARSFSRPIEELTTVADGIARGDVSRYVLPEGTSELRSLAESINRMSEALSEKIRMIRQNERRFRDLTESTNDFIWEIDDKFTFTYASPQAKDVLGRDADELVGKSFFEFLYLEDPGDIQREITSLFDSKKDLANKEIRRLHKDGSVVIVESSSVAFFKDDGSFGGYRGIDRDITGRKQIMSKVRMSEERYALAQRVAGIGSWDLDIDGGKIYWTDNAYVIFGLSKEEFGGSFEEFLELIHPDDRDEVRSAISRSINRGVEYRVVHRILRPDGTVRWISEAGNVLSDSTGRPKRMLGIVQDVTRRKEYEQEREDLIEELRAKTHELEEARNEMVRQARELESANEELELSNEELQTRGEELQSANEELQISYEELQETTNKLEEAKSELEDLNRNLEVKVEERTIALKDAQERLLRTERLATLGKVAGSLSHELRNPLGVMKNVIYYLTRPSSKVGKQKLQKYLDVLRKQIEVSDRIISSALDYTRPRAPEMQSANMNELIEEAVGELRIPPKVRIKKNFAEAPLVMCDPFQIKQVFYNILINCIQAFEDGGRIDIRTEVQEEDVLVHIKDNGPGIEQDSLEKIFEPLFSTKAKGIGLGLAIVKDVIDKHSGAIDVESVPGEGTSFRVRLPAGRDIVRNE